MKVAVPSYNRVEIFKTKTFKTLLNNGIHIDDIYLFVANEEQFELYQSELPQELKIVVGEKGMCNIRNFMTEWFDEGEVIVYMDDDIEKIVTKNDKTFVEALTQCCEFLKTSKGNLIGLPPTFNPFFNKDSGFKQGLYSVVGCFYIMRNDKTIKVNNVDVEDHQRTLLCYQKNKIVYRYCDIMVKTKPFASGGVNDADGRNYESYYKAVGKLYFQFPNFINIATKKIKYISNEEVPHIRFKPNPSMEIPKIIQLPKIQPAFFQPLLNILTRVTLSRKQNEAEAKKSGKYTGSFRKNFPAHRTDVFGLVKLRPKDWVRNGGSMFAISAASKTKTNLYEELKRIGDIIVPFEYTSILINNNTVSGKHLDASNMGQSLLVSIGDYEGCNIMIEGKKYDAKYQPLIFNGSEMEHWNTDDLVGNKYSLVFYKITN